MFGLTFIPVVALVLYVVAQSARRERALAFQEVHRWASIVSANQQDLISATRLSLQVFSDAAGAGADVRACPDIARAVVRSSSRYVNIGIIELDGTVSCSAIPTDGVNLAERAYFRQARDRGSFAYGGFQISRSTGQPTLTLGYPVREASGQVRRVAFAALDLQWLKRWSETASLPAGAVIAVVDESDTIVFRHPNGAAWIGKPFTVGPLRAAMNANTRAGELLAEGLDGVKRAYAYHTLPTAAGVGRMHVLAGVPESTALALTYRLRERAFIALALLLFTSLAIGWLLADRLVLHRIYALRDATRKLAAGDLHTRLDTQDERDELGDLAGAFDVMAESLESNRERMRAGETRVRFLADATQILTSSLDYEKTLQRVAELVVPQLSDWCVLYVRPVHAGAPPFRVTHHRDESKRRLAADLSQRFPRSTEAVSTPTGQVLRSGTSLLFARIPDALLKASAQSPEHERILREMGLCSVMVVPLRSGQHTLGVLTLVSAESGKVFDEDDLRLAEELGRRAAIAVENARLYQAARAEIRERRRAEKQVRQLNAELEGRVHARTTELEAVNRELEAFSYSVSHDLRSPLRSIDGFSQALLEDYGDSLDATATDFLKRIRGGAQRMARLIDELLSLAQVARREMIKEQVDLSATARLIVRDLANEAPNRIAEVAIAPDVQAHGDPGLLRVVLDNLLNNAWKFTSRKAVAHIEFGSRNGQDERVFYVRDDGAGFDMTYAGKLFGPFQRLHSMTEFEGTGIGLATVQRIVARHGGRVWADAKPNEGATFYFTLGEK